MNFCFIINIIYIIGKQNKKMGSGSKFYVNKINSALFNTLLPSAYFVNHLINNFLIILKKIYRA